MNSLYDFLSYSFNNVNTIVDLLMKSSYEAVSLVDYEN